MERFSFSRRAVAAVAAAVCIAVLAALILLGNGGGGGGDDKGARAQDRAQDRGVTTKLTVKSRSSDPQEPVARPAKLPALYKAKGKCWDEMNSFRDFMDENPYGAVLATADRKVLNKHLESLYDPKVSGCTMKEAQGFVAQEVQPWKQWIKPKK